MNKKEILLIAITAAAVLGAVFVVARQRAAPSVPSSSPDAAAGVPAAGGSTTRQPAPQNATVPDDSLKVRNFSVSVSGNQFSPNTVVAKVGDTVHFTVTAIDKDYDFTQPDYGFRVLLPKGKPKAIEFQATADGKFAFYCTSCGGPSKGPVGYLVIAPK